ncbi:hypothetical protein BZA77DRAFT_243577 [Pyronema omphalodes]|nr:hypothetical protein BZA77DRAFT_243577 [Pyronema omphalodes]
MSVLSPAPISLTRKRSPAVAFDADATPPSSRPPSRTHTKRVRSLKHAQERPTWVQERVNSTRVDSRIDGDMSVDVRYPNHTMAAASVGGLMRDEGFTVLCFLGMGGDTTMESIGACRGLLEGLGAICYGVSLQAAHMGRAVPIIHDAQRTLTKNLGLLHPLGGGRVALDAIVVLDAESRARMVLPIGWGVRGTSEDSANLWENVMGRVVRGVEWLRGEVVETAMEVDMLMY